MAIPHAKSAELIDISPLGNELNNTQTSTLIKTASIEVLRLVLPAGKEIKSHSAPGDITVQCLEGRVVFSVKEEERDLVPGKLLYVSAGDEHSLRAIDDASVLVTLQLKPRNA